MTLQPFRSFTATQRGTRVPATFAGLSSFSFAFWVRFTAPLAAGRIIRIGDPTDPASLAVDIRVATAAEDVFTQTNCFILTRRHRAPPSAGPVDRLASPTGSATAGVWLHLIASFPSGAHAQLYINGSATTLTGPDSPLTGAPAITSVDELAIGDPTPAERPGFVGDISRVTLFPFAMPAARAMITYRHQSDPLSWVGIGSKDALAATNHSPVAVPLQATAISGVPKTIDPRPVGFDQEGDTVSIVTGSATANPGSVVISSGALVYTPPASFVGSGRLGYSLRDTSGLTSVGRVDVAVTGGSTPIDTYPTTEYDVFVTSLGDIGADLRAKYNAAGPSTTIWYPTGANIDITSPDATWTFNRAPAGISAARPIIIRPVGNDWGGARWMNRINVLGPHTYLVGARLRDGISGDIIDQRGAGSRVSRVFIDYTGSSGAVGIRLSIAAGMVTDRCSIRILKGSASLGGGIRLGPCPDPGQPRQEPVAPFIDRCHFWGFNGGPGNQNGHEAIQLGEGNCSWQEEVRARVEFCLVEDHTNESEPISVKSSLNTFLNVILRRAAGNAVNRVGNGNIWTACWADDADGFRTWGRDHQFIGCRVTGGATFNMLAGNSTPALYESNPVAATNRPAALNTKYYHCEGSVEIAGPGPGSFDVVGTIVQNHTPAANIAVAFLSANHSGDILTGTAPGTKPTIVDLVAGNSAATNCGPFAP